MGKKTRATMVALLGLDPITRRKKQSPVDLLDTSEGGMGVGGRGGARCSAATELGGDGSKGSEERRIRRSGRGEWVVQVELGITEARRRRPYPLTRASPARWVRWGRRL